MPEEEKTLIYIELMSNTFKLIRWSGHWFPTRYLGIAAVFLSLDFWRSLIFISTIPLQMVPCIIDLILKIPDMPKVIMNGITTIYSIHALFRAVFMIMMGKSIWKIFKRFETCEGATAFHLIDKQLSQDATQKAFKSANKIFLIIIIGANVTGCLFTVTPFVISYEARAQKLQESSNNGTIPNVLVYEAWYPFDVSKFPVYQLTVLFQAFCGFIWINMVSTSDAIYLSVIIRAAEEFNVLQKMLTILSNINSTNITSESKMINTLLQDSGIKWPRDANILLHSWVHHHQLVLRNQEYVFNFCLWCGGVQRSVASAFGICWCHDKGSDCAIIGYKLFVRRNSSTVEFFLLLCKTIIKG
ncbi:uncharacterized protein LOC105691795 isoform X2 [Athalia rosae]|uniref:uncharacterized protein LOC105691795 isoform X2 n=1 Tax=Athalia rosae TaxID=37344 RepID=UPI0020346398|nr:uncharacterized protein LOC105691795 isoform X2 [Athalia rosae]